MENSFLTNLLNSTHKKDNFNCGKDLLDGYIKRQAGQDVKKRLSACFVLIDNENNVTGYYTLSNSSISRELLPLEIIRKLPPTYYNLPITLLGRLAIDNSNFGKGMGEKLLMDALKRAFLTSIHQIASMAVVVDPIDNEAISFYEKYGFILIPNSGKMFLTMNTISKLF
jgi:predicted GNAT family N-acyltransferase